jgi:hypothetical protein
MNKEDEQDKRIEAVLDGADTFESASEKFYNHLKVSLSLPCEVTGIEDFDWEEPYVFGMRPLKEYKRLKKTQPSYRDVFELVAIENDMQSEWMMFSCEDIAALVRRKSDKKEFCLGLAEIEAVDKNSPNGELLEDYVVWFLGAR